MTRRVFNRVETLTCGTEAGGNCRKFVQTCKMYMVDLSVINGRNDYDASM